MGGRYDRQHFLTRLLLLSAFDSDADQGSTSGSTSCNCCGNFAAGSFHVANMTSGLTGPNRDSKRKTHTPYVVDSGATLHCINDISLFDSIDHHHPKIKLRVANGKVLEARTRRTPR